MRMNRAYNQITDYCHHISSSLGFKRNYFRLCFEKKGFQRRRSEYNLKIIDKKEEYWLDHFFLFPDKINSI